MSLSRKRMRWRGFAWVLLIALAGCATTPRQPLQALDAEQQRNLLQNTKVFSFAGRVAISGQDSTHTLEWRQQRDESTVKLVGFLGMGSLQMEFRPGRLRLSTSSGLKVNDDEAEETLLRELGFMPPFDSLRYWVLGLPAPAALAEQSPDAAGRPQQLEQQGWVITYERFVAVPAADGILQMPALLVAQRGDLRLRLFIHRWRLR